MLSFLESGNNPQGLGVPFETAQIPHLDVEGFLALMTEGRMSKVVAPPRKLDQVNVQPVRRLAPALLVVEANGD
jgi:hypothetical protein